MYNKRIRTKLSLRSDRTKTIANKYLCVLEFCGRRMFRVTAIKIANKRRSTSNNKYFLNTKQMK